MKLLSLGLGLASLTSLHAANILAPSDLVIAVDADVSGSNSNYPEPNENPAKVIDGNNGTKYLNFGGSGSGFIVTPSASTAVQSMQFVTGNDAPERDPSSYQIYGTNAPITSGANSAGTAEAWTLVSAGSVALPTARNAAGPAINIINTTAYSSYKLVFPTITNSDLLQLSEVQMYNAPNLTGSASLMASNAIVGIDQPGFSDSRYADSETPGHLIDGNTGTKYLNFGKQNSGIIVKPATGSSVVTGIEFWTANDSEERDPSMYQIYGRNGGFTSLNNSLGDSDTWTLIQLNALTLPSARGATSGVLNFPNTAAFDTYKILFPDVKDAGAANSMQIAEVQLYGTLVPEPTSLATLSLGLLLMARRRR